MKKDYIAIPATLDGLGDLYPEPHPIVFTSKEDEEQWIKDAEAVIEELKNGKFFPPPFGRMFHR